MPCPPPKRFRPVGEIVWVGCSETPPPFIRDKKRRGRRAQGIRYEKKVHRYLEQQYGAQYFSNPWLKFICAEEPLRWCQPDGLIIDIKKGRIILIEVKYQHTADAWWQLRELYMPVIRALFGKNWTYEVCEVVKWYDPATNFPERVHLSKEVGLVRNGHFGVHIWRA